MKIAYKHLIKKIKNPPTLEELSDKFFQLGHEHEIKNNIFDFELTPNRGDCLSIRGILRELNSFYEVKIDDEIYEKPINELNINFVNNLIDFCPKISFLKVKIEEIPKSYNKELESYFDELQIKKINFFTDISNYISYETGQPTHCYDNESLGDLIELSNLEIKTNFETLIDKTIELNEGEPVFLNKTKDVINLAGIMGSKNSACSSQTKSVLLECAYFNPEMILGKTLEYAINSDAAYKFERNTDPSIHEYVLRRFLKIVQEHTKIVSVEKFTQINEIPKKNIIEYNLSKINKILGIDINQKIFNDYLENLGFKVNKSEVFVPEHRHDIESLNDIAEEVARVYGYDNINPKVIKITSKNNPTLSKNEIKIKNLLTDNGFFEVINDPFVSICNDISLNIDNPIDSNKKYLRTNLKNSLLNNLTYNERRQKDSIKLFEVSDIYTLNSSSKRVIGIIASGRVDKTYENFTRKIDVKYLNNIFEDHISNIHSLKFENISRESLNSRLKDPIFYTEFEIDLIEDVKYRTSDTTKDQINYKYVPISEFPCSLRDLSFSIEHYPNSDVIQDYILNFKEDLLKEVFIFDYFFNKKNKVIKIGFRFIFQDSTTTITEEQVNAIMDVIINHTTKLKGVKIPGLTND